MGTRFSAAVFFSTGVRWLAMMVGRSRSASSFPPAGRKSCASFKAVRPALSDRLWLIVWRSTSRLGHQPQGGDELGPRRIIGPAIGQLEAVADLPVGLPGGLLQLLAPRGWPPPGAAAARPLGCDKARRGPGGVAGPCGSGRPAARRRQTRTLEFRSVARGRRPPRRPACSGKAAASTAGSPAARAGFSGLAVSGKVFPRTAGRPSASALRPCREWWLAGVGWAWPTI